jgi:HEAT repeat protein
MRSRQCSPLAGILLLVVAASAPGRAPIPIGPGVAAGEKECACKKGFGACQHWLGIPGTPTADPCYCDRCREFSPHTGKDVPEGMNPFCFAAGRTACYLKRHALAWHLSCSECQKNDKCCPGARAAFCPDCDDGKASPFEKDDMGRVAKDVLKTRLEAEKQLSEEDDLLVLYNRHFYLVTDIRGVKVKLRTGFRVFSTHEYAHLMLERAEMARKEFVEAFGEKFSLRKPIGIFLPSSQMAAEQIQKIYMGSPKANQLYGGSDAGIVGGMCTNAFCLSGQKYQPDEGLHFAMRHMIAHSLLSIWVVVDGTNRVLPRWLFEGTAHWLSRSQERFKDDATFCGDEGAALEASGKGWEADCAKIAGRAKTDSIEKLFGKTALGQLTLEDNQRAWSYVDLCVKEWREPFIAMLADLRRGKEVRDSFMKHLQCTPEIFDERWRKRVTGKRRSMSPLADEDELAENESPTERERKALRGEADLPALAARIRALGTVDDPKTVDVLMDLFAKKSELVRETAMVALQKIQAAPCKERIAAYGLLHDEGVVRAYAARACGQKKIASALPTLRTIVAGDKYWLARAEAAIACGKLKDFEAFDAIQRVAASDPADKAQLAAMDAIGLLGEDAHPAVPVVAAHLGASAWQLRVAACQSLAAIGSMKGVDPLIERMEIESGHVHEEIVDALKSICRVDLGNYTQDWKKWWERQKERTPGIVPPRPKAPEPSKVDTRYAPSPRYYGIQIYSNKIGFVLDTSGSMDAHFEPDAGTVKSLSREYHGSTKLQICKEEISQTLSTLDSRAHFSIIVFNTRVDSWKANPVAASAANVGAASSWLQSLPPAGETNYYGGLRAALDLEEGADLSPGFRDTPDTLTFLTDGMPTQGEITDTDVLNEWYTSLNRFARIRTHVIAFGSKGVDLKALRTLAEQNGGKFVHVAEQE